MIKRFFYILIVPAILLTGCSNLPKNDSKKKVSIENRKFELEIADTIEEHRKGLMDRNTLEPDKGMLFIFDQKDYQQFWMKNTLIPLQVIMIDDCQVVDLIEMPKEEDPANAKMIYKSSKPANKAIELNAKTFTQAIVGQEIKELCK